MTTIHIKSTMDTEDKLLSELMNILTKNGFKTEKYLGVNSKIVLARKDILEMSKEEQINRKIKRTRKENDKTGLEIMSLSDRVRKSL
jgi:hypothetical protein